MKSLLIFIPLALLALFAVPDTNKLTASANNNDTDTLSAYVNKVITNQKLLLNEQETSLHSALSNLRDTIFITDIQVIKNTDTLLQTKEVPVYVEVPTYYKVVYSIYTDRGYHQTIDTIKLN